jgi:copper chaperone CopZ
VEHTYNVEGMHCQNCVGNISEALKKIEGVTKASVSLNPPEVNIEMTSHIPTHLLNDAVKRAGNYTLKEKTSYTSVNTPQVEPGQSLAPLFIIVGYLIGGVFLRSYISYDFSAQTLMLNFMGGFFVLFSLFKMIDLPGFADGYSTYDIIAKRSRIYALAYPFLELALGVAYFLRFQLYLTNIFTIILMIISSLGVFQALLQKRTIQCACLGTALKLPMTKVTLSEDLLMVFMAGLMLIGM